MQNSGGAFNEDYYMESKFLDIKEKYNLDTVIETGTYHGITTEWFAKNFVNVYTVECNEVYYEKAKEKIGSYPNISSHLQDSPVFLKEVLPLVNDSKTIIFLHLTYSQLLSTFNSLFEVAHFHRYSRMDFLCLY